MRRCVKLEAARRSAPRHSMRGGAVARRPAPGTRERILKVASELFSRHGVRAVGLQQVVDETGLGKSLLYREFASKDDLVVAWLHEMRAVWWEQTGKVIDRYPGDPARQLLGIV